MQALPGDKEGGYASLALAPGPRPGAEALRLGLMRLPPLALNGKVLKVEDESPVENFPLTPAKATA